MNRRAGSHPRISGIRDARRLPVWYTCGYFLSHDVFHLPSWRALREEFVAAERGGGDDSGSDEDTPRAGSTPNDAAAASHLAPSVELLHGAVVTLRDCLVHLVHCEPSSIANWYHLAVVLEGEADGTRTKPSDVVCTSLAGRELRAADCWSQVIAQYDSTALRQSSKKGGGVISAEGVSETLHMVAVAYTRLERYAEAVGLQPGLREAWFNLGVELGRGGTHVNPQVDCGSSSALVRLDSNIVGTGPWAVREVGVTPVDCFARAVEIAPADHEAWYNMGSSLLIGEAVRLSLTPVALVTVPASVRTAMLSVATAWRRLEASSGTKSVPFIAVRERQFGFLDSNSARSVVDFAVDALVAFQLAILLSRDELGDGKEEPEYWINLGSVACEAERNNGPSASALSELHVAAGSVFSGVNERACYLRAIAIDGDGPGGSSAWNNLASTMSASEELSNVVVGCRNVAGGGRRTSRRPRTVQTLTRRECALNAARTSEAANTTAERVFDKLGIPV